MLSYERDLLRFVRNLILKWMGRLEPSLTAVLYDELESTKEMCTAGTQSLCFKAEGQMQRVAGVVALLLSLWA